MRAVLLIVLAVNLGFASDAFAAGCRGLHGQFVPCPTPQPPLLCRDVKTKKPAKCKTPGAEPMPSGLRRFNG